MKHLLALDPRTGEQTDVGAIVRRRDVGPYDVWLTYDEPNRTWWIVALERESGAWHQFGYREERREICWQTFLSLDEREIAELREDGERRLPS